MKSPILTVTFLPYRYYLNHLLTPPDNGSIMPESDGFFLCKIHDKHITFFQGYYTRLAFDPPKEHRSVLDVTVSSPVKAEHTRETADSTLTAHHGVFEEWRKKVEQQQQQQQTLQNYVSLRALWEAIEPLSEREKELELSLRLTFIASALKKHFEGVLHAKLYGQYRPIPPAKLIERVVSYLKEKYTGKLDTAYDVGCGSGQSTGFFSEHFKNVVGTDISSEQIKNAREKNSIPNVSYLVSPAEEFKELSDSSIQLVGACQAAHWFDLPAFYQEVHRVLEKNGVLALYGYEFPRFLTSDETKNKLLYDRLQHLYNVEMGDAVLPGSVQVYIGRYTDEKFQFGSREPSPFQFGTPGDGNNSGDGSGSPKLFGDFTREDGFYEDSDSTLRDYINYCLTWSGWQNFKSVHGEERAMQLIHSLEKDFLDIIGTNENPENIQAIKRTKFFLLLGRK
ncbi:unnamed protein product [Allacma fusca]|uniref:Methyltransferase type 11 domain-containing protein n=1 Tax=Allacma fusca TaxID=39272 RepID=A0A8J2K4A5_9HEXA|nr:unnamed protein product [Allacma fusca]